MWLFTLEFALVGDNIVELIFFYNYRLMVIMIWQVFLANFTTFFFPPSQLIALTCFWFFISLWCCKVLSNILSSPTTYVAHQAKTYCWFLFWAFGYLRLGWFCVFVGVWFLQSSCATMGRVLSRTRVQFPCKLLDFVNIDVIFFLHLLSSM